MKVPNYIMEMIMDVAQGNPGAIRVIRELQWFTKWYEIMKYCKKKGIVGDKLWIMYKDEFECNSHDLGRKLEKDMYAERYKDNKKKYGNCGRFTF